MGRERPRPCVRPRTGRLRGHRAPVSLTFLNALGATRKSREHVRSIGRGDKSGALAKLPDRKPTFERPLLTIAGRPLSADIGGVMKKTLVAAIMIALLAATARAAEVATNALGRAEGAFDRRFGAGVILGEPIGASLKYWLN